ncbi:MAG: hypothetical protein M3O15_08840, partial [Acidobacteriota bacterium]|nr:hypothetical protein [Acidobacteriota bacterium]
MQGPPRLLRRLLKGTVKAKAVDPRHERPGLLTLPVSEGPRWQRSAASSAAAGEPGRPGRRPRGSWPAREPAPGNCSARAQSFDSKGGCGGRILGFDSFAGLPGVGGR